VVTSLHQSAVGCRDGMDMRSINTYGWINVYLDGESVAAVGDTTI
jgi:hypothetical protein